jgi:hypothetical protein
MIAIAVVGTMAILAGGRNHNALAFGMGAMLGILNFHWLRQAVDALMKAQEIRIPRVVVAKMFLRYPLVFAGLLILNYSGWLPMLPVVAGLLVPGCGAFIESLFLIGAGLRGNKTA